MWGDSTGVLDKINFFQPQLMGEIDGTSGFDIFDENESIGKKRSQLKEYHARIWIDVTTFAEGIGGWRISLTELLHLARAINGTLVEPCMKNGRLGSCFDGKMPVSEIFNLSKAMQFNDQRPPLMVSHDVFREYRATPQKRIQYNICMTIMKNETARCSQGTMTPATVNGPDFRKSIMDVEKKGAQIVLQLEDYWRSNSIDKLAKLFGLTIQDRKTFPQYQPSFHPKHIQTVEDVLRKSNITDDNFSAIHWRAEKRGMDYAECAKAVLYAKHALQQKSLAHNGQEKSNHQFVLMSSLNKDTDLMWDGSKIIS